MPTDWLVEFWKAAQQASPFGAMGAVLALIILWRAYRKGQDDLLQVTVRAIESQVNVERTLDSVIKEKFGRAPRRRRRRSP